MSWFRIRSVSVHTDDETLNALIGEEPYLPGAFSTQFPAPVVALLLDANRVVF